VPSGEVDVNVHPAKYEVRFRRQSDIHHAIVEAVQGALRDRAKQPLKRPASADPIEQVMESPLPYAGRGTASQERNSFDVAPAPVAEQRGFFSSLFILGQILGCYLVGASEDGLVLIDQHAAHERVAFAALRRQMAAGTVDRQALLIPQPLELSAGERSLLEQKLAKLERAGFVLEPFGPDGYTITAIPAVLPDGDYRPIVRQMISELAEVENSNKLRQHVEERLATIACHSVIRANRKLGFEEMRALLRELDHIDFATQCPHGRPVLIEFSRDQLARMFKRIV
jgi:DNA mismatch repair protein MutL